MKIGLVVPGFSSDERDWCIPALLDFVRVLAARAEVHVFALRYPHRIDRYPVYGATVHSLNGAGSAGLNSPALWARAVREIAAEHRRAPFDGLHAFWAYEPGPVAAWAGRRLGVPVVVSLAGGEVARLPAIGYGLQLQPHRRALVGWALRRARAVTAGSRYLIEQAGRIVDRRAHVHWTPLGVDTEMFAPEATKNLRSADGDCARILCVASLMPVKGHETLLRAFAIAGRDHSNARLTLAGQDSQGMRPRLEQLAAELGIAKRVEFMGEVAHEALPEVYRSAAFCVQASRHEAQGLAVLEVAACGVPTVGTTVGLLPELMPAEWLAQPNDVEGLANLMFEGITRPQRLAELGQALRSKVASEFGLEACVERFWRLYHK